MIEPQPVSAASQLRVMPTTSGHNVLLSATDFELYHLHITRFFTHYRPEGQMESELVQRLTDTEWRIHRIARLEMALYAHGQVEFASLFVTEDPNVQSLLLEAHTHKAYARQLKELSIQESRLRRYFEKDAAALADLQADRVRERQEQKQQASEATAMQPIQTAPAPSPNSVGFEFSSAPCPQPNRTNTPVSTLQNRKANAPATRASAINAPSSLS